MQKKIFTLFLILSFLAVAMGCAQWSRTQNGAAIGANDKLKKVAKDKTS